MAHRIVPSESMLFLAQESTPPSESAVWQAIVELAWANLAMRDEIYVQVLGHAYDSKGVMQS